MTQRMVSMLTPARAESPRRTLRPTQASSANPASVPPISTLGR